MLKLDFIYCSAVNFAMQQNQVPIIRKILLKNETEQAVENVQGDEMKVFSTLRSDQIDLARTSSEGVAGLKAFLEHAEKGKNSMVLGSNGSQQSYILGIPYAMDVYFRCETYLASVAALTTISIGYLLE